MAVVVIVVHIVVIGITPPDWGQATWLERKKGQGAAVSHRAAKDGVGEAAERYRITQGATWTISRRYESKVRVQAENTPFLRRAAAVTAIIKRRQWPTHSRARVHVTDVLLLHRIIQFTE
jgi:hypothetical protein